MTVIGGLRARLLQDSLRDHVRQCLDQLGWLAPNRYHQPIILAEQPNHWSVPVVPNTIAVDFAGSGVSEWEVGSDLTSDLHTAFVEIFAEDDSLGTHLAGDLRDWLRGRLAATPMGVTFPIYDFQQGATPPIIGYMDIDPVSALRNVPMSGAVWLRHWYRVRCEIRDTYLAGDP